MSANARTALDNAYLKLQDWLSGEGFLLDNLQKIMNGVTTSLMSVIKAVANAIIGMEPEELARSVLYPCISIRNKISRSRVSGVAFEKPRHHSKCILPLYLYYLHNQPQNKHRL